MRLTPKLLSFLNRVFDKDPVRFLALRLSYNGQMTWTVRDAVLTTEVSGGSGQGLTIDLSAYTLSQLVQHLSAQPGYSVLYADFSELSGMSARVLVDGSSSLSQSNGDHLYGYTSVLWSYLEAFALELQDAAFQIGEMLKQMSTRTASDMWLDELGGYYGVPRTAGETDALYGKRIIAEVLRPRGNNIAIANAIKAYTGQDAVVTDVVIYGDTFPLYDGAIEHGGGFQHNADSAPLYGLFDVEYGYDILNGGDFTEFQNAVRALVGRLRDAGTHLRSLALKGSEISDALNPPIDGAAAQDLSASTALVDDATPPDDAFAVASAAIGAISDALPEPVDTGALSVTYAYTHNGIRRYDGSVIHSGGTTIVDAL